jgi:sugar-specific transcriptional regulator TrmB
MSKETESSASPQDGGVLFNQILKEAMGISDPAAEAYKSLLAGGALTVGEISANSGLDYAHTSKAIAELENERLIRKISGVIERFTAVPPYGGFVGFLKDFQKIAKNMEDNATGIVESSLTTIDKNCGEWKKEAQQAAKSNIAQTVSEIDLFKESSSRGASDMLEKLKQESEATKTMVTDAIKKHVDQHKVKSAEVEAELSSGIDNVMSKFDTEAKKYLKDVTETASTFLDNYKGTIQTFVETLRTSLQQYKTETKEGLTVLENEVGSIQSKLDEKARTTVTVAKTKSSDVLESQRKILAEKSLQLQSGIREVTDRFMKTATGNLNKFKSSVDGTMKELSAELTKSMSEFKEKTTTSLDKWWSTFKSGVSDSAQQIYSTIDLLVKSLIREGEQLISLTKGMVDSYASRVKSSFDELRVKMEEAYSTGLASLTGATSAIKGTLSGIIASQLSSSQLMASFLESTLSTIIPSCSNALETVSSEINKNALRITSALSKSNEAALSEISHKAMNKLSSTFPALEKEVNSVVERVLASTASVPTAIPSSKTASRKSPGAMRKTAFTAEVKETLKSVEKKLLDELKEYLNKEVKDGQAGFAQEVKKLHAETSNVPPTNLKNARLELGKGEVVASSLLPKFAEYSSSIENFEKQITDMIDVTVRQYVGEGEIAKKALNDLILRQDKILDETMRKINESVNARRASRTKELGELVGESHSNLDSAMGKHLDELDEFIQQSKSSLLELVSRATKATDATRSSAQSNIASQIGSTLNTCKEITESTTNSVRAGMISATDEFDKSTTSLQKDLSEFMAKSSDEIKSFAEESMSKVSERKEALSKQVEQKVGKAVKELADTSGKHIGGMIDMTGVMSTSLTKATSTSLAEFNSEGLGAKDRFHRLISSHLQDYEQEAFGASGTCGYLLNRSYEKYREASMVSAKNHGETLLSHQTRYENAINTINSTLVGCIDKNEALIKEEGKGMLTNFRENIDRLGKVSASVEWVLQSAWMELEKTPQYSAEHSWPIVSTTAIMTHIQDMIRHTKSYMTIALPTLSGAPLEDIQRIKKATRATLIIGDGKNEPKQEQTLTELAKMGNVSIRASPGLAYYGCTKDSEEILLAPMTQKENETIGIASTEDGYIDLFEKLVLPALLAPSYDLKEPGKKQPTSKTTKIERTPKEEET